MNYAQQLIQAAQAGKTDTIEIDNGAPLKDGTYTLEEKNYSHNYRVVFSITVKDGKLPNLIMITLIKTVNLNKMMKNITNQCRKNRYSS